MKTSTVIIILAIGLVGLIGLAYFYSSHGPTYFSDASKVRYFYRDECIYCQQESKVLTELAPEGFRVKKMDVGVNPALMNQYNITGTPTFIAEDGARKVGLTQKEELKTWLLLHGGKVA